MEGSEGTGEDALYKPRRESQKPTLPTPWPWILAFRSEKNSFLLFKPTGQCFWQPKKTNRKVLLSLSLVAPALWAWSHTLVCSQSACATQKVPALWRSRARGPMPWYQRGVYEGAGGFLNIGVSGYSFSWICGFIILYAMTSVSCVLRILKIHVWEHGFWMNFFVYFILLYIAYRDLIYKHASWLVLYINLFTQNCMYICQHRWLYFHHVYKLGFIQLIFIVGLWIYQKMEGNFSSWLYFSKTHWMTPREVTSVYLSPFGLDVFSVLL
jgi:hypothetical protein